MHTYIHTDEDAAEPPEDAAEPARGREQSSKARGRALPLASPPVDEGQNKRARKPSASPPAAGSSPLRELLQRLEDIRSGAVDGVAGREMQRLLKEVGSEIATASKFKSRDEG